MRFPLLTVTVLLVLGATACAGTTPPAAAPESESALSTQTQPDASADASKKSQAGLPTLPPGVPAAAAECDTYLTAPTCDAPSTTETWSALADAVAVTEPAVRDQALAQLESCSLFEAGLIRSLRAELAPRACADAMVGPLLEGTGNGVRAELLDALQGAGLAARLARLPTAPPELPAGEQSKESLGKYVNGPFAEWLKAQASAVYVLSSAGARLVGYGKGLVAVESGIADMRLVEVARSLPLPKEFAQDPELKEAYYASLDQALEARKQRGRDAALVGLGVFAQVGALSSDRVVRARELLSTLFGGRRIDALDGLLLPALPPFQASTAPERLAASLPTFHASMLLADHAADAALLRAWVEQGLPFPVQQSLGQSAMPETSAVLYARALLRLGQTYWRSGDFKRAAEMFLASSAGKVPEARLVNALAVALRGGPRDAAEMMLKGPLLPNGVGDVSELDTLAQGSGEVAALAAYDAGHILAVAAPAEQPADYWREVAKRFRRAEQLFPDAARKKQAAERRRDAESTARAVSLRRP